MSSVLGQKGASAIQFVLGIGKVSLTPDLERRHLLFQAVPGGSNIYWLVGHLTVTFDMLLGAVVGRKPNLPEALQASFGMNTEAKADGAGYPPWEELVKLFIKVHEDGAAEAAQLTEERLATPFPKEVPFASMFPTAGDLLVSVPGHTSYHLGQVNLLRRMQGLPSPAGRK